MVFRLLGTRTQQETVQAALNRCDFPFELLLPSLQTEGRTEIQVSWEDLSRFRGSDSHSHTVEFVEFHAHEQRDRVLGLFYLPPNTKIVLDNLLNETGNLAHEVFLSEAAHAVDYHYMTNAMRFAFWNAVHPVHEDLPDGSVVTETGDLHHGHSWFEGPAGYGTWVGEAWMEGFVKAFSDVPVTINLAHPVPSEARQVIRAALLPVLTPPLATPADVEFSAVLRRYLRRLFIPKYFKNAALKWLSSHAL